MKRDLYHHFDIIEKEHQRQLKGIEADCIRKLCE